VLTATLPNTTTITITSEKATCQQHASNKKLFTLTYVNNVHVNFSQGARAKGQMLTVELSTEKSAEPLSATNHDTNNIKKITLNRDVSFFHEGREAYADHAVILPGNQQCQLTGNVRIVQKKTTDKDLPVEIVCGSAAMDLVSGKIDLTGTEACPVSTTLVITKTAAPLKKKRTKKHGKHPST
jgi:hypothetical protein